MENPEILKREIKALAFDQYGTIVDMQRGLVEAVTPFLQRKGWHGEASRFVTWWRRTHFESSMIDALWPPTQMKARGKMILVAFARSTISGTLAR